MKGMVNSRTQSERSAMEAGRTAAQDASTVAEQRFQAMDFAWFATGAPAAMALWDTAVDLAEDYRLAVYTEGMTFVTEPDDYVAQGVANSTHKTATGIYDAIVTEAGVEKGYLQGYLDNAR